MEEEIIYMEEEIIPNFSSGDIECRGCRKEIHLYFNGGELDRATCCGYTYSIESTGYELRISKK